MDPAAADGHIGGQPHARKRRDYVRNFGPRLQEVEDAPRPNVRGERANREGVAVGAQLTAVRTAARPGAHTTVEAPCDLQEVPGPSALTTVEAPPNLPEVLCRLCVGCSALAIHHVTGEPGYVTVAPGQVVEVLYIGFKPGEEGWLYVQAPTGLGWLHADSVEKIPPPPARRCPHVVLHPRP